MEKLYYVYMITTQKNTALYTGITSDLIHRIWQHKEGLIKGFTKKYNVKKLVYFEEYKDVQEAIHREKCIKRWKREWKEKLIEKMNPEWKNLCKDDMIPASAGMTTMEDTRIAR